MFWPFHKSRIEISGRRFSLPRWVVRHLREVNAHGHDISQCLGKIESWMARADEVLVEIEHEEILLVEMPFGAIREDTKEKLDKWWQHVRSGDDCASLIADCTEDIASLVEYSFGKLRVKFLPGQEKEELKETLRSLREELLSVREEMGGKQSGIREGMTRVRQLLQ